MIFLRRYLLFALFAAAAAAATTAAAQAPSREEELDDCLSCHGEKDFSMTLPSGETQSLHVSREAIEKSIHGKKVGCTGCHPGRDELPHPERAVKNRKEFAASYRDLCKSCHFDNYTKALDGVHYAVLSRGEEAAPFCADCHGAHDITRPTRAATSQTCSACHSDVAEVYDKSVHGSALAKDQNPDVPVCTDCHRSHDIANPHAAKWKLSTVETCGRCHADAEKMKKYGLSANVLSTYLSDFHGMSASLYKGQKAEPRGITAVCTDCHGVHDIARVKDAGSKVLAANLRKTCQKCHADASASFPAAWLSHYQPSLRRAPLVYAVSVFYKVFIPFIIGGLVLQILLSLWRWIVNR